MGSSKKSGKKEASSGGSEMREDLLSRGRARPHRAGVKGYISYPIQDQEDASVAIEILGWNYDRAEAAAERRAANQEEPED